MNSAEVSISAKPAPIKRCNPAEHKLMLAGIKQAYEAIVKKIELRIGQPVPVANVNAFVFHAETLINSRRIFTKDRLKELWTVDRRGKLLKEALTSLKKDVVIDEYMINGVVTTPQASNRKAVRAETSKVKSFAKESLRIADENAKAAEVADSNAIETELVGRASDLLEISFSLCFSPDNTPRFVLQEADELAAAKTHFDAGINLLSEMNPHNPLSPTCNASALLLTDRQKNLAKICLPKP
jgi:hypothetical protein